MSANRVLVAALAALSLLYGAWFLRSGDMVAAAVFALPPAALALLARLRQRATAFWSGVLALVWFSHGVMVAWSRPPDRGFALAAVVLSLMVVFAANAGALRARFSRRQGR